MPNENVPHSNVESPIGDIAYLARSRHRVPTLVALTERPRSRSELRELTDVSSSTMRRTLDEFEARIWIRKDGHRYTATRLGEVIASCMTDLIEAVETERKLRNVWHWLPEEIRGSPVETWAAMTVTVAQPDDPYRPVNRFESLLLETTRVRYLRPEVALMEPCFDDLDRILDDGVDVTLIDRPKCHTYFITTYPDRSSKMARQENFTVLAHDELPPYGIGLLDDLTTLTFYEQGSGTVQAMVDTDEASVRRWAQSMYETHRSEARPVEP